MDKSAKIYVAGHRGLAGSAIVRNLERRGYSNLLLRTHSELELANQTEVDTFFADQRPQHVFVAAAKVGGIHANNTLRGEFIYQNLIVQCNLIHAAWRHGVERLIFLGSSCIYPRDCPQPMKEEYLLGSMLETTNLPYAIAKISGIEMCRAYNHQYGTRYLSLMPTNLYGPGDSYDLQNSHVLPALIRKLHAAKQAGEPECVVWGSGKPRREFLYVDDLAEAVCFLATLPPTEYQQLLDYQVAPALINVGFGSDLTISELTQTVAEVLGFAGNIKHDLSKPDGTPKKLLDSSRLLALGWKPQFGLQEGVALTYRDFLDNVLPRLPAD